jgi:hypothetical protein
VKCGLRLIGVMRRNDRVSCAVVFIMGRVRGKWSKSGEARWRDLEELGMETVKPSLRRARMSRLLWRWEVCGTSAM